MTKLTYILLGLALAGLTACVDLNEQLVGSVTTQYFATGAGLEAAMMGDYALQKGFWGLEQSFAVTEFGTDLETNGDQGGYIYENTYAGGLSAADTHYQFPWTAFFRSINTSNAVIGRAPLISDMATATKATRIAEAKFLRALNYFWLVQIYGDAYLTTTESKGVNTAAVRTPSDSVYLQIIKGRLEPMPGVPCTTFLLVITNSPRYLPIISGFTSRGTNSFPLWTPIVSPTIDGRTIMSLA
jgi:hypothetical protein